MKLSYLSLAFVTAFALPTMLPAQETEGRRLALLGFNSIDSDDRGFIDQGQFWAHGSNIFVSMDYNDDGRLTLGEFLAWDYGMLPLAQDLGREDAYYTALRVVFAFWDLDGDKQISRSEHRKSIAIDFARADTNNDAVVNADEFTSGFSVMVALRAAINPEPAE